MVLGACAQKQVYISPYHKMYADWTPVIKAASVTIQRAGETLGYLHEEKLITDVEYERGRNALILAETARKGAEDTLGAYMLGQSSRAAIVTAINIMNEHLIDILLLIDGKKVGTIGGEVL
jgi:hypothetical protein